MLAVRVLPLPKNLNYLPLRRIGSSNQPPIKRIIIVNYNFPLDSKWDACASGNIIPITSIAFKLL